MSVPMIANEIRNPLASIRAQLELLQEQTDTLDPRREPVDLALDEVERISASIDAILDHHKTPEPRRKACDLALVLDEATRKYLPKAERRGIRVHREGLDRELPFLTDPSLVAKAVGRLLDNAIDASKEGGEAQVFCDVAGNEIEITISDHGEGIQESDIENLGEPFFSRKSKGLGLGVHLAKRDLALIGADVEFRSKAGMGTTVLLRLKTRGGDE